MRPLRNILAVSTLAILTFIYFSDILFSDRIFSFRDLSRYYYPMRMFAFEQIKSGIFPFWNQYVSSGHPLFAALQSAVLYPLSFVYLVFNFNFAFNFFIILHIFLGGMFFYILMRDLKFNHIAAVISAVVFMFSGYLIGVINLTTTLSSAIWFPLVFLFFNRLFLSQKAVYAFLTAFFMGVMFLGGEPTPLYATVFLLGVYSLLKIIAVPKDVFKICLIFISPIVLMLLLFSFQILPFAELIRHSTRLSTDYNLAACWSFHPRDLVNLIMPFFYGPLTFNLGDPIRQDWLLLTYFGAIPVLLFLIAFVFRRDDLSSFFKLMFLLGLLLVFGRFTPLYKIFYDFLPGFNMIRYPIKFFFISAVSFSFLAGAGWQEYCNRIENKSHIFKKFIKGMFVAAFLAALLFLALYIYKFQLYSYADNFIKGLKLGNDSLNYQYFLIFMVDLFNFRRLLLFIVLGCTFLFIGSMVKMRKAFLGAVIIGLIFADLLGGKNIEVNPTLPAEIMRRETSNIAFLKKDKTLHRIYSSYKMIKENEVLRGDTYENAFAASLDSLCPNRHIEYGIQQSRGYLSIHNDNYSKVMNIIDTSPYPSSTNLLNMLNVKYIITPDKIKDPHCKLVNKGINAYIYENKDCLGRAYLVKDFVVVKKELDIAAKLKSKDFKPDRLVILEEGPDESHKPQATSHKLKEKEYVNVVKYEANKVEIEAQVVGEQKFLILADNYYPGWEAYVDGKKQKLYKANYCLRAVSLPIGKHKVVFVYNPVSFKIGLAIAAAALLSAVIILLILRMKK